jgi:hypothetical protein
VGEPALLDGAFLRVVGLGEKRAGEKSCVLVGRTQCFARLEVIPVVVPTPWLPNRGSGAELLEVGHQPEVPVGLKCGERSAVGCLIGGSLAADRVLKALGGLFVYGGGAAEWSQGFGEPG